MKVSLFCNAGMSTSLVASKLKKAYLERGIMNEVEAFDFSALQEEAEESDVIILGPQIAWALDDVTKDYPEKKVIQLTLAEFGSMDGEKILERVEKEFN
ncbi:transcription antiterminator [Listeria welshimeri]|uniref:PTS sugar transporter subunit IIB n=1 Tax=Listeria welshimeri TaxID=1643 RepID=UPI0016297818|nr:transcription antiterminator [Listeria welshimeri]MBC1288331.1 transcription antiterminator [Listeria welshimeri]MBC1320718.1 transcription antiterminator [Listeria welshimeri]MBC1478211.1 transcription antiterminator [Listeria welshimeri]MBC1981028.1 transcription antiterminator [Listeria welshimeri]MBC2010183.1 transcription antiterminator [Listeria welshimeri]